MGNHILTESMPDILVLVEASPRSVSSRVVPWFAKDDHPISNQCRAASGNQREHVIVILDAVRGLPLSARLIEGSWRPGADA